jgi:hypothetical protein
VRTEAAVGALLLLAVVVGQTAAEDPSLELSAPAQAVSVGDRVVVEIRARGGDGLLWGEPELQVEADGPWAVVEPPRAVAGAAPPVWQATLAPFKVGELELPEVAVSVRPAAGAPVTVVAATRPAVTVASVLSDEAKDPAPLRDPVGVEGWPWEWLPPVLAVAVPLAALAWLLWRLRRRRRGAVAAAPALPPLDELEAALAALAVRVGRDPAEGVCDRLAWILRNFLERRTGEPALEMTSFELRLAARRNAWPDAVRRDVQRAMEVADAVRFGRRAPAESELRSALDAARAGARLLEDHLRPAVAEGEAAAAAADGAPS